MALTKTEKVLRQLSNQAVVEKRVPIATDMFLPNHSGDHSHGIVNTTPTTDTDIANKKYVDDAITAAGHTRQHSIIDPLDHTSTATSGQMLKADANGLPVNATNTDVQVAGAVTHAAIAGGDSVHVSVAENTNWDTAYTHSQDNTQAHSDYMLNVGDTATGTYNFDSGTLYVDGTNHRVGIGQTAANAKLQIVGAAAAAGAIGDGVNLPLLHLSGAYNDTKHVASINNSDGTRILTLTGAGKLGILNSAPASELAVGGTGRFGNSTDGVSISYGAGYGSITGYDLAAAAFNDLYFLTGSIATPVGIVIKTSGYVGIGTASPVVKLQVETTADGTAQRWNRNAGGGIVDLEMYNSIGGIGTVDSIPFRLNTNNAERIRIEAGGNVGIGTTSPSAKLTVAGGLTITSAGGTYEAGCLGYTDANWGFLYRPPQAGANAAHAFYTTGGSSIFQLTEAGDATLSAGYMRVNADASHAVLVLNQDTPATYACNIDLEDDGATRWVISMRCHDSSDDLWFYNSGRGATDFSIDNTAGYVGVNTAAAESPLEVETSATVGMQAVTIDQNDDDQAFIDYQGTSAASAAKNISTWTNATLAGYVKVEINGSAYWMPYYNAPTS